MNAKPNETPQQRTRQSRTDVLHDSTTDGYTTVRLYDRHTQCVPCKTPSVNDDLSRSCCQAQLPKGKVRFSPRRHLGN
jgi:hypothetical protein